MKKWTFTEILITVLLALVFGTSFTLLLLERYFTDLDLDSCVFGLTGVYIDDEFTSYASLTEDCNSEHILAYYCEFLGDLDEAGVQLQGALIGNILILGTFLLITVAIKFVLKKLIALFVKKIKYQRGFTTFAWIVTNSRLILFVQPVVLVAGLMQWVRVAKINEFERDLKLAVGTYMAFVACLFSLGLSAAYAYYFSGTSRRNRLFMLKQQVKGRRSPKKTTSFEFDY